MQIKENTCCFIGHRKINETEELKQKLTEVIENLIVNENVDTFLFGSKSEFNDLCRYTVTELKKKYPKRKEKVIWTKLLKTIRYQSRD